MWNFKRADCCLVSNVEGGKERGPTGASVHLWNFKQALRIRGAQFNGLFLEQEGSAGGDGAVFSEGLGMRGRSCGEGGGGGGAVRRESELPEYQRERGEGGGKRERSERGEKSFRTGRRSEPDGAGQDTERGKDFPDGGGGVREHVRKVEEKRTKQKGTRRGRGGGR